MLTITTDKPIEVDVHNLSGSSSSICFMPAGSKLSFLDGTFLKVCPCPDFIVDKLNYKKK